MGNPISWLSGMLPGMGAGEDNGLNEFLFGSDSSMDPFNKKSLDAILQILKGKNGIQNNQTYQGGNNFLQNLFSNDPQQMQQFQQPYMDNFNQNIVPDISNRFAGMGTGNSGLSSSGFQQTLAQAGRGLQRDLAQMRGQQQMQGLPAALQYAQQPISNQLAAAQSVPGQYFETPGQSGLFQSFAQGAGKGAGQAATNWLLPGG